MKHLWTFGVGLSLALSITSMQRLATAAQSADPLPLVTPSESAQPATDPNTPPPPPPGAEPPDSDAQPATGSTNPAPPDALSSPNSSATPAENPGQTTTAEPSAPIVDDGKPIKPVNDGPVHEAFLSPSKDANDARVEKSPPPPIMERPGIEAPSTNAQWIEGYWDWDPSRADFVWVTGTWRVPPPGRFWVNGYWKRDDTGWYRVAGFWSERKTDRLDFRKDGPPADHPADEPGPSPGPDHFYIPGQYYPDGEGVIWKPGFWTKVQPGWSWVPAQWVKQPEGWTFQEGYWDRTLEDRGTLFAPATVDPSARTDGTVYQPYTQISASNYGLLYGALGRPNSYYDGYPGCYYDDSGQYYGYASYGTMSPYYGYLDYPFYGSLGYPYYTSYASVAYPIYGYGGFGGYGYGYTGYGLGFVGNTLGGLFGFGYPFYGLGGMGYGYGYPLFGMGYGGWGLGGLGFGGWGYPLGGWGFGGFGSGFNNPWRFGRGGFWGLGRGGNWGIGRGGNWGMGRGGNWGGYRHHNYPFRPVNPHRGGMGNWVNRPGTLGRGNLGAGRGPGNWAGGNRLPYQVPIARDRFVNQQTRNLQGVGPRASMVRGGSQFAGSLRNMNRNGVIPPPASRPFASPFQTAANSARGPRSAHGGWNSGFNGVRPATRAHTAARPVFTSNSSGMYRGTGANPLGSSRPGGLNSNLSNLNGHVPGRGNNLNPNNLNRNPGNPIRNGNLGGPGLGQGRSNLNAFNSNGSQNLGPRNLNNPRGNLGLQNRPPAQQLGRLNQTTPRDLGPRSNGPAMNQLGRNLNGANTLNHQVLRPNGNNLPNANALRGGGLQGFPQAPNRGINSNPMAGRVQNINPGLSRPGGGSAINRGGIGGMGGGIPQRAPGLQGGLGGGAPMRQFKGGGGGFAQAAPRMGGFQGGGGGAMARPNFGGAPMGGGMRMGGGGGGGMHMGGFGGGGGGGGMRMGGGGFGGGGGGMHMGGRGGGFGGGGGHMGGGGMRGGGGGGHR